MVLPYTRVGVVGGIMLGLGRALGETMAVTFVIGNAHRISASILAPGTTISASIANEFTEAVGDLYTSSLIALGLILFVITFVVLALAQLMLARMDARAGGLKLTAATATRQRALPAAGAPPTPGADALGRGRDLRAVLAALDPGDAGLQRHRSRSRRRSSPSRRRRPGSAGGLANAIYGSVVMTVLGTLIGAPVGILAGTYLAEYGKQRAARRGRSASSTTSC